MEERNYSGELPAEPPEGLIPWLHEQGCFKTNLLIYRMDSYYEPLTDRRVRAVELHCTACGEDVFTDKVPGPAHAMYAPAPFGFVHPETGEHLISGNNCLCPCCGEPVKTAHVGSIPNGTNVDACWPVTITRIDDRLVIIGWNVHKHIRKTGEVSYSTHGYEAYVIEEKRIIRLNAYRKFMSNVAWGRWEQRKKYSDVLGYVDLVYPWDVSLLEGSTAENSKLDILLRDSRKKGTYPIGYLRVWQKKAAGREPCGAGGIRPTQRNAGE
ncbi:hypothetical protein LJC32_06175 [Oscillospiraceae bacterium OttesenSCG-928-F05]|nr:hypothetical protein [Oscillospiraceae bacterium OttesenSCG-928-F05]